MTALEPLPYSVRRLSYDARKGAELWPNGARMAVLIYTCPEEWNWNQHEPLPPAGAFMLPGEKKPSLSTRTAVQYGFEIGLRRLRDVMEGHGLKLTLGTTGNAAERHPELIGELHRAGHEIAAHGYSEGTPPVFLTRQEQALDIDKTVAAIEKATGEKPRGWWSPGAMCNVDTVELLAERGFLYHGDLQDDELPYFIDVGDKTLVEIPYNMVGNVNDYFVFVNHRRSIADSTAYLTSTFDAYYEQAGSTPLYLIWGTHPFVSGRPDTAHVFSQFVAHMKQRSDVWFPTYGEMADWWRQRFGSGYRA